MKFKTLNYENALAGEFGADKKNEFQLWGERLKERRFSYPFHKKDEKITEGIEAVKSDGIFIFKNFFKPEELLPLKEEFDGLASKGLSQNVLPGSVRGPENEVREKAQWYAIAQPFVETKNVFNLAFSDKLLEVVSTYFNCVPSCIGLNLRKSFANSVSCNHTELYHQDGNSPDFIKTFIYLNDVDLNGGPFTVIKKSHTKKFDACYSKYRWSDSEIHSIYGEESIYTATAKFGDLVVATPNAFHKGLKPKTKDRTMLTFDWSVHSAYFKKEWGTQVYRKDLSTLDSWKLPAADYLKKV